MKVNYKKREDDNQYVSQDPLEDIPQEERLPEFDEIGTALNGI